MTSFLIVYIIYMKKRSKIAFAFAFSVDNGLDLVYNRLIKIYYGGLCYVS